MPRWNGRPHPPPCVFLLEGATRSGPSLWAVGVSQSLRCLRHPPLCQTYHPELRCLDCRHLCASQHAAPSWSDIHEHGKQVLCSELQFRLPDLQRRGNFVRCTVEPPASGAMGTCDSSQRSAVNVGRHYVCETLRRGYGVEDKVLRQTRGFSVD